MGFGGFGPLFYWPWCVVLCTLAAYPTQKNYGGRFAPDCEACGLVGAFAPPALKGVDNSTFAHNRRKLLMWTNRVTHPTRSPHVLQKFNQKKSSHQDKGGMGAVAPMVTQSRQTNNDGRETGLTNSKNAPTRLDKQNGTPSTNQAKKTPIRPV